MMISTPKRMSLILALALMACGDSAPTTPDHAASQMLASHHPAAHGVNGWVGNQSLHAYADVAGGSAAQHGGSVHLSVDGSGPIPRFPDAFITTVAVFGFAWADVETGAGLVSVIHPVIGRDSRQNPDGWHTHPVQLTGGTASSDFCVVDIGRSQAGVRIHGDAMRVTVPAQWLPAAAADLDVVAAFVVQADAGCLATGLGVAVLDAEPL